MKKYIDLEDMVNLNCSNILSIIQKNKEISRKEITGISGLSWGGMTKIVNRLLENGYISEKKSDTAGSAGRTPGLLTINTDKNFVMGMDINKTGLSAIVMNLAGETLGSFSDEIKSDSKDGMIEEITRFAKNVLSHFDKNSVIFAGVAMQGTVDSQNGISIKFPGIADWHNVDIKSILEEELGIRVFAEHDPDCLLYPHIQNGKKENTVLLRIDRSVGMSVAINGKIIKGTGIFEIAHTVAIPEGNVCRCGGRGCLEAYVRPCSDGEHIYEDKLDELILPLGITLKNVSEIFGADRIILTGTLMENKSLISDKLCQKLSELGCVSTVEFHPPSDYAVRGASLLAINKSINSVLI